MGSHLIFHPDLNAQTGDQSPEPGHVRDLTPAITVTIRGDEAHHAIRVKRLVTGDPISLCDGAGLIAQGNVGDTRKNKRTDEWELDVALTSVACAKPTTPRICVHAPAPKGDALESMIDGLSQVGAAAWIPFDCERAIVDPREGKLRRLKRTAEESLKQCGRTHLIGIGESMNAETLLSSGARVIVADKSGAPYRATGEDSLALVIGPEGGLSPNELETFRTRGAIIADFGVHVMRIEVAAVAACAILIHAERTRR
jgi:16S rRNA (uracil1498-N3)-methyltransferase